MGECVEQDKTYTFTNVRIREDYYTNEKLVNTAKYGFSVKLATPFTEALPEVQPSLAQLTTHQINAKILGVKFLSSTYVCHACSKKLEDIGNPDKMRCSGCKMKQKPKPQLKHWFTRCFIEDLTHDNTKLYLSFFHHHVVKLFQLQGKEIQPTDNDETIEDVLLDIEEVTITHHINGSVIDVLN